MFPYDYAASSDERILRLMDEMGDHLVAAPPPVLVKALDLMEEAGALDAETLGVALVAAAGGGDVPEPWADEVAQLHACDISWRNIGDICDEMPLVTARVLRVLTASFMAHAVLLPPPRNDNDDAALFLHAKAYAYIGSSLMENDQLPRLGPGLCRIFGDVLHRFHHAMADIDPDLLPEAAPLRAKLLTIAAEFAPPAASAPSPAPGHAGPRP